MKNATDLKDMEVVWVGNTLLDLQREAGGLKVDALVVGLDQLGSEPGGRIDQLARQLGPELVIITYDFARKDLIQSLQREDTRVLPAPVTLSVLRSQLTGLIVRNIYASRNVTRPSLAAGKPCPTCGSVMRQTATAGA